MARHKMRWTWNDDDTFSTTRDDGATLVGKIHPDLDPDFSWLEEGEDANAYEVYGLVLSAQTPDGRPYGSTSTWGITFHQSATGHEVREYMEAYADDIAPDLDRLERLALLLLP